METNEKKCPYCAEVIKAEAIICRFCQRDLPKISPLISIEAAADPSAAQELLEESPSWKNISPEQKQLIEKLGISYDGEQYHFQAYRYDSLIDAVNYAESQCGPSSSKNVLPRVHFANFNGRYTRENVTLEQVSSSEAREISSEPRGDEPRQKFQPFQVLISIIIFIGLLWYFFGGGVSGVVAQDFQKQYEMAQRGGSAMDVCVRAGLVAEGYLQAHDSKNYQIWKVRQQQDCAIAGLR